MACLSMRAEEECDAVVVDDTGFMSVYDLPVFFVDLAGDCIAVCAWWEVCADRCCALHAFEQAGEERHD